jgi:hypothetical protein
LGPRPVTSRGYVLRTDSYHQPGFSERTFRPTGSSAAAPPRTAPRSASCACRPAPTRPPPLSCRRAQLMRVGTHQSASMRVTAVALGADTPCRPRYRGACSGFIADTRPPVTHAQPHHTLPHTTPDTVISGLMLTPAGGHDIPAAISLITRNRFITLAAPGHCGRRPRSHLLRARRRCHQAVSSQTGSPRCRPDPPGSNCCGGYA